jgi:hypothetical protein
MVNFFLTAITTLLPHRLSPVRTKWPREERGGFGAPLNPFAWGRGMPLRRAYSRAISKNLV